MTPDERQLDIDELESKIRDYSNNIRVCDSVYLSTEIEQFLYFLDRQDISKRILERINEDYSFIKNEIPEINPYSNLMSCDKEKFISLIKTQNHQGALGYFLIKQFSQRGEVDSDTYLYGTHKVYHSMMRPYEDEHSFYKDKFLSRLFDPFIYLIIEWYMKEIQVSSDNDYLSESEREVYIKNINDLLGIYKDAIIDLEDRVEYLSKRVTKKEVNTNIKGLLTQAAINGSINLGFEQLKLLLQSL